MNDPNGSASNSSSVSSTIVSKSLTATQWQYLVDLAYVWKTMAELQEHELLVGPPIDLRPVEAVLERGKALGFVPADMKELGALVRGATNGKEPRLGPDCVDETWTLAEGP